MSPWYCAHLKEDIELKSRLLPAAEESRKTSHYRVIGIHVRAAFPSVAIVGGLIRGWLRDSSFNTDAASFYWTHHLACHRSAKAGGLNGVFKPARQSENREKALRALEKVTDQAQLFAIATDSSVRPLPEVRVAAVEKMSDQNALAAVAKGPYSDKLTFCALRKLNDEALLVDVTLNATRSAVSTFGTRLPKEALSKITDQASLEYIAAYSRFDEVRISIDGEAEFADGLRGAGSTAKAAGARFLLRRAGVLASASVTVAPEAEYSMPEIVEQVRCMGFASIRVHPLKAIGRAKGILMHDEPCKDMPDCGKGQYLNLLPDGSAYPCHELTLPEYYLGNIFVDGYESIAALNASLF